MEVGVLNFTPEEYQILEDIEFDETIERPEAIRFYTLSEQTTDAYEKLMPRGRSTRFQRDKVRIEVDRLQELYEEYVAILPETYALREPEKTVTYDWVSPVYAVKDRIQYNWDAQYSPVFANLREPNFIPRLIAALPRPHSVSTEEGVPAYEMSHLTEFVFTDGGAPIRGVPDYEIPRTQFHEDRTISIVLDPLRGTGDKIGFQGYYLRKRPLEIPRRISRIPTIISGPMKSPF